MWQNYIPYRNVVAEIIYNLMHSSIFFICIYKWQTRLGCHVFIQDSDNFAIDCSNSYKNLSPPKKKSIIDNRCTIHQNILVIQ